MSNHPIAIIGAMNSEVELLKGKLEGSRHTSRFGYDFYSGTIFGKQLVIVKCGIGKVNAARGTQMLIDLFEPELIINTGVAGGLGDNQKVGDMVIATALYYHDFDLSPIGYVRGALAEADPKKPTAFIPDEKISSDLFHSAQKVLQENSVWRAPIVSGDVFLASQEQKEMLRSLFHPGAGEMESTAIAHVATYAGIPFAIVRALSDLANGEAPASFADFEVKAANLSAEILLHFLQHLS